MKEKKPQWIHLSYLRSVFVLVMVCFNGVFGQTEDCKVIIDWKNNLVLSKEYAWTGIDCCKNWEGIGCQDNRVTRIQLKEGIVTGTLTKDLKNLTNLQHLEFNNEVVIGGALPTLRGLNQLQVVLIHDQNFTSIPDDFFEGLSSLQGLFMDKNPLAPWEIPVSLSSCQGLVNFTAESTNLRGKIPDFFNGTNFASLVELRLGRNMLEGGLPLGFSTMSSLQTLWLNEANLSGNIDVLGGMEGLVEIVLNKNSFTGPIPDLSLLKSLAVFNLRDNQLTGPVPNNLTSISSLRVVNLTNNLLQGPKPVFDKAVNVDMIDGTNKFCKDQCSDNTNMMLSIVKNWGYPAVFLRGSTDTSDACNWLGVTCPNGNGNITVINFKGKGLTGMIPVEFASLKSLTRLDLSNNLLYGPIPKELATLPLLKTLDVSNNDLSGGVPDFKGVVPVTVGNAHMNETFKGPPPSGTPLTPGSGNSPDGKKGNGPNESEKKKSGPSVGLIVGLIIGSIIVALLVVLLVICLCKRRNKSGRIPNAMVVHPHNSGSDPDLVKITVAGSNMNVGAASETYSQSSGPSDIQMVEAGNMVISIQVLRNVTNNFSEENVLGRGGFGTVYKGELHDGTMIAVKRMESGVMGTKGLTEFKSEIDVLNKVRHRHLVSLIGYCLDGNERILVYEYMPKGTLSQHLFGWKEEGLKPLEWTRRLSIALDVARGVEYLHGLASQSFIHRDLKPSNILLGDDMKAKVADFGLVRLAPEGKASIETRLAGTFGYLAPEYAATGRVTTKVDVYAFGVILMELITGRKALDESQPEESMHLVTWFRRMTINKDTARKAIDPTIDTDEESLASISTVSELAGYCCSREPHQRPDMGHVVNVLSSLVELWKPSDTDPEDIYAIDMELSLAQTLKKWQAFDGDTSMDRDNSSFLASVDNTQTSIPTRPSGFADSFTSADGR